MQIINSWLKVHRSLGAVIGITVLFCALVALGKLPAGPRAVAPSKSVSAASKATGPKLNSGASLVPPFVGDHTEKWEEFPGGPLSSPASILNGFGTVSGSALYIYNNGGFGLCGPSAGVSDGNLGLGINSGGSPTTTITFSQPVIAFGAYWGGLIGTGCGDNNISLAFFDANGQQIDNDSFIFNPPSTDGNNVAALEWRGYHFITAVKTITYTGNDVVTDGMQVLTSCAPAPAGMISWWKAEGNANDSQDSNNAVLENGAGFASGEVGQAFSLKGDGQYVRISDTGSLDFESSDFSIDAWINTTASGQMHIYSSAWNFQPSVLLFLDPNSHAEFTIRDNAGITLDVVGTAALNDGNWHHLTGVRQGTTAYLYVDGTQVNSASNESFGAISLVCGFDTIGGNNSDGSCAEPANANFFLGLIDEVEVFNRALQPTEVATIFAAGSNGKCGCTPAPDGMISWWPGDGNNDDIQDGNNLAVSGSGVGFGSGEVRQAFSFSGNGYLTAGDPDNLRLTGTEVTLDAWVNPTNAGESGVIAGKTADSANDYLLYLSGGFVVGIIKSGGSETTIGGGTPPPGVWTHVALVYDGSTIKTYFNGALFDTVSKSGNLDGDNAEVAVGGRAANDLQLVGLVDEVEVFGRALSASEIAAIYNAGGGGKCHNCTRAPGGMAGWWPGNGNANDVIGHNDGTLQNGATFGAGKVDQGFSLDGNDDSVTTNQTISTNSEITLDAWINASTLSLGWPVGPVVFEKGVDITNRIGMQVLPDGSLCGYLNSDVLNVCSTPGVIAVGQFIHVALTLSNNGEARVLTLYANGQQVAQVSGIDTLNVDTAGLIIGDSQTSGFYDNFAGIIDEVEMFGRALSQSEIQKIFDAGTAGKCACTPPPESMVSWWPGDGNTDDIQDGNNGTFNGTPAFATGEVAQGFSLNGVDQYVEVPDSPNLSITGPFTIDAWINTNDNTTEHAIVEKYDGGGMNGYVLRIAPGGHLAAFACDASTCASTTGATLVTTGTFHHVAAVFDGTFLKVYLDGVQDGTGGGLTPADGTNTLEIGARGGSSRGNFFNGVIDEVEIFNRALSDSEIAAIYNAAGAGKCKPQPTPTPTPSPTPSPTPTPTPTPSPTPTPTPSPTPSPTPTPFPINPTDVDGTGTIQVGESCQATFQLNVKFQQMKKKTKLVGNFSYSDPCAPLNFRALKVTSLTFNNNQAHFTGTAKIGKQKISFSVDVTDNGSPGTNNDFFSIQVSNGYSASGYLTSGNISVN